MPRVPRRKLTDFEVEQRFFALVNMTADDLRSWLETPESKLVGFTREGETESVGRQAGKRIVRILEEGASFGTREHMRKTVGFIKRHLAWPPAGDVRNTRWRYALMNWGHDPLGEGRR